MCVVHVLTILDTLLNIPTGLLVGGWDCMFSTQIQTEIFVSSCQSCRHWVHGGNNVKHIGKIFEHQS